jgi:carbohydrate kinase (thermoresistant glucokinase family)
MPNNSPKAVILMGVAGSGKTAVGKGVATRLNWLFLDADVFHPAANIEKMKQGIPLNDEDRTPWLRALRDELKRLLAEGRSAILACSALKESYRQLLSDDVSAMSFWNRGGVRDLAGLSTIWGVSTNHAPRKLHE